MLIRVLGAIDAVDRAGASPPLGGATSRRVLAHIVAGAPAGVTTPTLVERVWGAQTLDSPGATVRMTISRLRRALAEHPGDVPIVHERGTYRLAEHVQVDAQQLEHAVSLARRGGDHSTVDALEHATRLWRGEPYDGLDGPVVESERSRLLRLRLESVERYQKLLLAMGRGGEGLDVLQATAAAHPLHEGLAALMMTTLYVTGDQTEALAVYERTRERLLDELGLAPSPELQRTQLAILRHEIVDGEPRASLDADQPVGPGVRWVVAAALTGRADAGAPRPAHPVVDVFTDRAESSAVAGHWQEAERWYGAAIDAALETDDHRSAAELCLRLARITWDPELGSTVRQLIRTCLNGIDDPVLAARLRLCLAGGTFRSGADAAELDDPDAVLAELATVRHGGSPTDIAWATAHARDAVVGAVPADVTLSMSRSIEALDLTDPIIVEHNARAMLSDLLRLDQRARAGQVVRAIRRRRSSADAAVDAFGRAAAENCWNLAMGRFGHVRTGIARALEFGGRLGGATLDQVLLAQSYWLTRELGDTAAIVDMVEGALALAERDRSSPIWCVAAAAMATDIGDHDRAGTILRDGCTPFDLADPPNGSHRLPVLSLAAETLAAMTTAAGHPVDADLARRVLAALRADHRPAVLVGWPAVYFGSKDRFVGFALLAAGRRADAVPVLRAAVRADRCMPPLRARSLDALAAADDARRSLHAERAEAIRSALLARAG